MKYSIITVVFCLLFAVHARAQCEFMSEAYPHLLDPPSCSATISATSFSSLLKFKTYGSSSMELGYRVQYSTNPQGPYINTTSSLILWPGSSPHIPITAPLSPGANYIRFIIMDTSLVERRYITWYISADRQGYAATCQGNSTLSQLKIKRGVKQGVGLSFFQGGNADAVMPNAPVGTKITRFIGSIAVDNVKTSTGWTLPWQYYYEGTGLWAEVPGSGTWTITHSSSGLPAVPEVHNFDILHCGYYHFSSKLPVSQPSSAPTTLAGQGNVLLRFNNVTGTYSWSTRNSQGLWTPSIPHNPFEMNIFFGSSVLTSDPCQ